MSPNRRIALNFIATYGRTIYTVVLGLICGRWTFKALGEVDYGLMGLVGGLTILVTFVNTLMANAVSRFFAYSVGQSQVDGDDGLVICRRWFNIAVFLHLAISIVGLIVGYPIGAWAVRNFLIIPADRVEDCIWVWRIVCAGSFIGMISVPFNAMYGAKQYIAELTVYTFVTSTLNAFFLYYMVTHPGVWLVPLTLWGLLLSIAPQIIIAIRAVMLFPECRFVPKYMLDIARMKELFAYALYRFIGSLRVVIYRQGMSVLVNKFLGPTQNAAMSLGGTVSGHCNDMGGALVSSLSPAITNAYGAGQMERVQKLSYAACRVSAVMALCFVLPLLLEAEEVFRIWIGNPPAGTVGICRCLMLILITENASCGLYMPIYADGRIKGKQIMCLVAALVGMLVAWMLLCCGVGIVSVGYGLLVGQMIVIVVRLYYSRKICGFDNSVWIHKIAGPLCCCGIVSLLSCVPVVHFMPQSLLRIMVSTIVANLVLLPLSWKFILGDMERIMIQERILNKFAFWRR